MSSCTFRLVSYTLYFSFSSVVSGGCHRSIIVLVSRICSPMSKKATVDYLRRYFKEEVSLQKVYRYLNKLYNTQQELVQEISVKHTKGLFGGNLGILFYDVTTLYFETTNKDGLRESGFSKDGKNANSQVVLGLLVSRGGYPLSYSLFNGLQYEEFTMFPIVDDFIQRFKTHPVLSKGRCQL